MSSRLAIRAAGLGSLGINKSLKTLR